jgi:YD repeat-containing protein
MAFTYYAYDAASNRLETRVEQGWGHPSYFTYDLAGRSQNQIDAYDGARRLSKQMFDSDPWIYYAYDAVRNQTIIRDATGTSIYARDKLDRLTSKSNLAGNVYYEWDASGLKSKLTDPGGESSSLFYDSAGRLTRVELSNARAAYYAYDSSGLLTKKRSLATWS